MLRIYDTQNRRRAGKTWRAQEFEKPSLQLAATRRNRLQLSNSGNGTLDATVYLRVGIIRL